MNKDNGLWKKAGVIITIIVLAATIISGYTIVCGQVQTNKIAIGDLKNTDKKSEDERKETKEAVIRLQADVDYIKEGIDDIKRDLRER